MRGGEGEGMSIFATLFCGWLGGGCSTCLVWCVSCECVCIAQFISI